MIDDATPGRARRAFDDHGAFAEDDRGYRLVATVFDGRVEVEGTEGTGLCYRLTVRAPTLSAATEEDVGPSVEAGWLDTYELRLEDAPGAVRDDVALEELTVLTENGTTVVAEFSLVGDADRAPAVAEAVAQYAQGTYVEGVVPGYTYEPPVSELLSRAREAGDGDGTGPMPL
jgi:hypothetical protein